MHSMHEPNKRLLHNKMRARVLQKLHLINNQPTPSLSFLQPITERIQRRRFQKLSFQHDEENRRGINQKGKSKISHQCL
jgi:hypothetical protein